MASNATLHSLFLIALVGLLAPILVGRLPHPRIPEVVVLLLAGIAIGPHALGWAHVDDAITLVADVGLGMLFFFAGFEIDRAVVTGPSGRAATRVWVISMALALVIVGLLGASGYVRAVIPVSIALTTTALGTLIPILRDAGVSPTAVGQAVFANGAIGEILPIIAISLFLSTRGLWIALVLLGIFGVGAFVLASTVRRFRTGRVAGWIRSGAKTTSQTHVRASLVLLIGLLALSSRFGIDAVLAAFAAGAVLRIAIPRGDMRLESQLEGIGFGFLIPVFFVVSGMHLDIGAIIHDPLRMLVFFCLIAVVRGVPVLIAWRRRLPGADAIRVALYTATGLPLIVAITDVATETGVMRPDNAAALVGAGLLTVMVFPLVALVIGGQQSALDVEPALEH